MPEGDKKKEVTVEQLKAAVGQVVNDQITTEGLVKLGDLKAHVLEAIEPMVRDAKDDMKKVLEDEVKKLANLPGADGGTDVGKDGDKNLKGLNPTGGYNYFAEFARDVYLHGKGASVSPKMTKWFEDIQRISEVQRTAGTPTLEIGDPEEGGVLAPAEFSKTMLEKGFENADFAPRCTKIPMAINQIGIPFQKDFDHTTYLHGAMQAYWLDEKAGKTASKPKFGKVNLRLNKLVVLIYVTDELLEDSVVSMEPLLKKKTADVIKWKIDESIFRGTGVGQPKGILSAKGRIDVGKETGQAAATIVYQNVVNMYSRCYPQCLKNAVWVANLNIFPQLATMSLVVGTGGAPAWMPAGGLSGQPYDTLMGKQIIWTEHSSTLGTRGDLALADFSQYLVGQKTGRGAGIAFASSIHLKFDYDQTAFRFVLRIDGQPWWADVFTPKRGSTQAPFVFLETRS